MAKSTTPATAVDAPPVRAEDFDVRSDHVDSALDVLVIATREEQTPEGLASFHRGEIEKWFPIIKAANIKPE